MIVRDRSDSNIHGTLTGHSSLSTAPSPHNAVIPAEHEATEVSIVEGATEPCSAEYADGGGSVSDSHLTVDKSAGVRSKPGLMRAHQTSTITHDDHKAIHGAEKCGPMPGKSVGPVVANLGRPPIQNNIVRSGPAQERPTSSTGVTARVGKGGIATGPAVWNGNGDRLGAV